MKPKFRNLLLASSVLLTISSVQAGNTWTGGGASTNWSDANNWGGAAPVYGTLTFNAGGAQGTTSVNNSITSMNQLLWTGTSAWTLNNSGGTILSLFDNGGTQAKIENQSTGLVTINAPITFAATTGNNWGEINAVNGGITFGTGTLTVNGSGVNGIRLFGSGQTTTFNNTVSAANKYFATTGANTTVAIGGAFTSGDFYLMNNGTLRINTGGTLTTTGGALRLGGDFGTTGSQNLTQGATLQLVPLTGGLTTSALINTVSGNTSAALLIDSLNTSGTNTLAGDFYLDSNLRVNQASGGTITISDATTDIKAQTLTLTGAGGIVNLSGVVGNSVGSGQIVVGVDGTAGGPTVNMSQTNTYSGQTFVRAGTLAFTTATASANNSVIRLGSTSGSGVTAGVNLTLAAGGTTLSSTINAVTTSGSGTLSINSNNTSGTNTLSGQIALDRNLTITQAAGGTLNITQVKGVDNTTGNDIKGFTETFTVSGTTTGINVSGTIYNSTGSGSIVKDGTGTLTLSGANTYSGTTTLSAGTLRGTTTSASLTPPNAFGSSALQLNGGTFALAATGTINNASFETVNYGNNTTVGGNVIVSVERQGGSGSNKTLLLGTLAIGANTLTATTNVANAGYILGFGATTASGAATFTNSVMTTGGLRLASLTLANSVTTGTTTNITFDGGTGTTTTITGAVSNNGVDSTKVLALTKNGAGTLLLNSNNTFTGNVVVNGGTLQLAGTNTFVDIAVNGATLTSGGTSVGPGTLGAAGGTITFTGTSVFNPQRTNTAAYNKNVNISSGTTTFQQSTQFYHETFSGVFSGAGTLVKNDSNGQLTFSNSANSFTGAIRLDGGVGGLTVNSLADSANPITFNGNTGAFSLAGGSGTSASLVFGSRQIVLGASGTISNGNTDTTKAITIAQPLGFSGTVGTRTLTLGGSNTGANAFNGNITNYSGQAVSLTKSGTGTWALGGTNNYSGATTLGAGTGTLILKGASSLSPNTTVNLTVNSGGSQIVSLLDNGTGTNNFNAPFTFVGGNTTNATTINVDNNGSGTGGTQQIGTYTWNLAQSASVTTYTLNVTGGNSYRLASGAMTLSNLSNRTPGSTFTTVLNPTTAAGLTVASVTMAAGNAVNGGVPVLELGGASGTTSNFVSGIISNASDAGTTNRPLSITKTGSTSTWTLNGANSTYSGTTTVTSGTLASTAAVQGFGTNLSGISIGGSGILSLLNDSTLSFTNGTSAYNIANSATGATINVDRVTGTGTNTITVGNLTTTSAAATWALNFTGANGVSLNAGALTTPTIASASHTINNNIAGGGSLTLASVTGGGTGATAALIFTGTGDTTVTGAVTQTATSQTLGRNSSGTLTLLGNNTYSGLTTVSGTATLTLAGDNIGAGGGVTVSTGGTGASTPRLNINSATALGTGTLNFTGGAATDTVRLDNTSLGGLVTVSTNNVFTMSRNFAFIGTQSLDLGNMTTTINAAAAAQRTINVTANTLTLGGTIGESAAGIGVNKTGAGTLVFNGLVSYTGVTTIGAGGSLQLGSGSTTGRLSATSTITNSGNLTINRSNAFTQASDLGAGVAITGIGSFTQAGAGTTTLTANNTYQGVTTISAGTLSAVNIVVSGGSSNLGNAASAVVLGSAAAQGTLSYTGNSNTYTRGFTIGGAGGGRLDVTTPGQTLAISTGNVTGTGLFTVGGAGDTTVNSNLTHTGGLTKANGGTMTISATSTGNTYTGATTVSGGILAVNGTLANTSTTVQTGATLQGSGTIGGSVTVQAGGTLASGNSIQSLATGALSLAALSTFAYEADKDAAAGVAGDLTAVTGNLTLDVANTAILTLTDLGAGSWAPGEKLTLISYSGTWNGGLFDYGGTLADDSTFTFSGIQWLFNYNDLVAGSNFTGDLTTPNYVTMTAIPEPRAALLGAIGLLALLRRRR